ncbi:hypothetical protein K469DRAFT_688357, partial [Zopfia rhizophila CBS 207.26]
MVVGGALAMTAEGRGVVQLGHRGEEGGAARGRQPHGLVEGPVEPMAGQEPARPSQVRGAHHRPLQPLERAVPGAVVHQAVAAASPAEWAPLTPHPVVPASPGPVLPEPLERPVAALPPEVPRGTGGGPGSPASGRARRGAGPAAAGCRGAAGAPPRRGRSGTRGAPRASRPGAEPTRAGPRGARPSRPAAARGTDGAAAAAPGEGWAGPAPRRQGAETAAPAGARRRPALAARVAFLRRTDPRCPSAAGSPASGGAALPAPPRPPARARAEAPVQVAGAARADRPRVAPRAPLAPAAAGRLGLRAAVEGPPLRRRLAPRRAALPDRLPARLGLPLPRGEPARAGAAAAGPRRPHARAGGGAPQDASRPLARGPRDEGTGPPAPGGRARQVDPPPDEGRLRLRRARLASPLGAPGVAAAAEARVGPAGPEARLPRAPAPRAGVLGRADVPGPRGRPGAGDAAPPAAAAPGRAGPARQVPAPDRAAGPPVRAVPAPPPDRRHCCPRRGRGRRGCGRLHAPTTLARPYAGLSGDARRDDRWKLRRWRRALRRPPRVPDCGLPLALDHAARRLRRRRPGSPSTGGTGPPTWTPGGHGDAARAGRTGRAAGSRRAAPRARRPAGSAPAPTPVSGRGGGAAAPTRSSSPGRAPAPSAAPPGTATPAGRGGGAARPRPSAAPSGPSRAAGGTSRAARPAPVRAAGPARASCGASRATSPTRPAPAAAGRASARATARRRGGRHGRSPSPRSTSPASARSAAPAPAAAGRAAAGRPGRATRGASTGSGGGGAAPRAASSSGRGGRPASGSGSGGGTRPATGPPAAASRTGARRAAAGPRAGRRVTRAARSAGPGPARAPARAARPRTARRRGGDRPASGGASARRGSRHGRGAGRADGRPGAGSAVAGTGGTSSPAPAAGARRPRRSRPPGSSGSVSGRVGAANTSSSRTGQSGARAPGAARAARRGAPPGGPRGTGGGPGSPASGRARRGAGPAAAGCRGAAGAPPRRGRSGTRGAPRASRPGAEPTRAGPRGARPSRPAAARGTDGTPEGKASARLPTAGAGSVGYAHLKCAPCANGSAVACGRARLRRGTSACGSTRPSGSSGAPPRPASGEMATEARAVLRKRLDQLLLAGLTRRERLPKQPEPDWPRLPAGEWRLLASPSFAVPIPVARPPLGAPPPAGAALPAPPRPPARARAEAPVQVAGAARADRPRVAPRAPLAPAAAGRLGLRAAVEGPPLRRRLAPRRAALPDRLPARLGLPLPRGEPARAGAAAAGPRRPHARAGGGAPQDASRPLARGPRDEGTGPPAPGGRARQVDPPPDEGRLRLRRARLASPLGAPGVAAAAEARVGPAGPEARLPPRSPPPRAGVLGRADVPGPRGRPGAGDAAPPAAAAPGRAGPARQVPAPDRAAGPPVRAVPAPPPDRRHCCPRRKLRKDDMADFADWRRQARELGWRYEGIEGPRRAGPGPTREERIARAYEAALPWLERELDRRAVVSGADARTAALRGLIAAGIEETADVGRVTALFRSEGVRQYGEATALVWGRAGERGEVGITTALHAADEAEFMRLARAAAGDRTGALRAGEIAAAAGRSGLAFEGEHGAAQRRAMHRLGEGGRLGVVVGAAGSGKTTLLRPLVAAWTGQGRAVHGVALAWRQADDLAEAGIAKENVRALSVFLDGAKAGAFVLDRRSVVVVDELGLLGTRQGLELLRLQEARGFRLAMLGDDRQCQAIEAGPIVDLVRRALGPDQVPEILTT